MHDLIARSDIPRDFGFTETHGLLLESARRFLQDRFPASALRALHDGRPVDPHLAGAIAELGWLDGRALTALDAALLCEELGRVLCPVPVASTLLASQLLAAGGRDDDAQRAAEGALVPAVVFTEGVVVVPRDCTLLIAPAGDDTWRAASVRQGDGTIQDSVDPTRAERRLDLATMDAKAWSEPFAAMPLAAARAKALTWLACETVGAASAALALTRDYACERKQFGRPIGTFQAVSHPIVNSMIAIEGARSLALAAAAAIDADSPALTLARMAKAAAAVALRDTTSRGVQLHGGFGFTWDCDMHFFMRRSLHDHAALGSPESLRAELLAELMA